MRWVGESVGIFSKTGLHAIQTLLKIPAVSPVRQSIESKPSERSSAERRGLDRFVFKSPACQGVCGKEESTVRKKGACA